MNDIEGQSLIPAIMNYTRVQLNRECGVGGKTFTQYRDEVVDGQLQYGTMSQTFGATLRLFPGLENAERLDMIAKSMRFANECRQQVEHQESAFKTLFWKAMHGTGAPKNLAQCSERYHSSAELKPLRYDRTVKFN